MNLKGIKVLITGATSGIGYATALEFAKCGAHIIFATRSQSKTEEAFQKLRQSVHAPPPVDFEYIPLDLSSFDSVRECADRYLATHDDLHILICNAGVLCAEKKLTVDGNETTFQINHLSHFLLANLLLPALQNAKPPVDCDFKGHSRLVVISSTFHSAANLNALLEDPNLNNTSFSPLGWKEYAMSKLANVMFAYEMNRRLQNVPDNNVNVYAMHPGTISSDLYRELSQTSFGFLFNPVKSLFFSDASKAAKSILHVAASPTTANDSGLYYSGSTKADSSRDSHHTEAWKQLWNLSAQITNLDTDQAAQ